MTIETLIAEWGLPALALGALFEGDAVAFVGGVLAHRGLMTVTGAWVAVAVGAMGVDNFMFHLGRHSARVPFVKRLLANPVALRVMAAVGAHPIKIIFGFRFVWGTRTFTPPVLGAAGVNAALFFALDAVSVSIWAALFVALGYGLGLTAERMWGALTWREHLGLAVAGAAVLAAGVFFWWRRRSRRLRAASAAADPAAHGSARPAGEG